MNTSRMDKPCQDRFTVEMDRRRRGHDSAHIRASPTRAGEAVKLTPRDGRRIRKRLEELAALERAVIDAAVERRLAEQVLDDLCRDASASDAVRMVQSRRVSGARIAEDAAVDALLAVQGKPS